MAKINVIGWKTFKLRDLFEILLAKGDIQPQQISDGEIPLVSAGNENNGIMTMIDTAGDGVSEVFPAGCISVSMFGRAFYQADAFYAVSHGRINVLKPIYQVSYKQGLFIASCLNQVFAHKFDYASMCTQKKLMSESISLPATPDGQPDWAYMDAYMSEVLKKEEVFAEQLASLTAEAVADGHKLDTSGWKAFRIGELFTQERGKEASPLRVLDGSVNMVAEISNNNGISKQGQSEHIFAGNAVTVSVNYAQNVFYQPYEFCASVNVLILRNSNMTRLSGLFIVSVLRDLHVKFSYVNKISKDLLNSEIVYLPVTSDGQPDWAWMERYMQQQMDKAETLVEHLDAVWG